MELPDRAPHASGPDRPARLLVIALDAADPRLIEGWSEAGNLPVFAELRAADGAIRVENPPGIYTGAVWPSFATGVSPARHGRYFSRQIRTGTYRVEDFPADEIHQPPFWQALSASGRRVAVIDVPKAPAVTGFAGMQIAEWGLHDPEGTPWSRPVALIDEVRARFGRDPVGSCDLGRADARSLARLRDGLVDRVRRKAAMSEHYLARGGWDLFLTTFTETHCAGHQLWHLHDPGHPRHDRALAAGIGDPLRDVYVAIDAAVGRLLRAAGPDATVLVYASHGMGPHYDGTHLLDEVLRRIDGGAPRLGRRVIEKAREAWRRTPASFRQRLRPLSDRFYDASTAPDRDALRFFVVPTNDNCAGIRLNLVGREPNGRVRRGADYDAVCAELAAELGSLVEVDSGRPVVREVLRTDRTFAGDRIDDLPDLLVRWHRDAPVRGVASPRVGRITREYRGNRTGDHRSSGALFARGRGVDRRLLPPTVRVTDLAPTIGAILGVTLPGLDGCPIAGIAGA